MREILLDSRLSYEERVLKIYMELRRRAGDPIDARSACRKIHISYTLIQNQMRIKKDVAKILQRGLRRSLRVIKGGRNGEGGLQIH